MGAWLTDTLCTNHTVAIFDKNIDRLKYFFNVQRFVNYNEITEFEPELVINAVSLQNTISVFKEIDKYLTSNCIISDIASVKGDLEQYYKSSGRRFVSTHPMFGPTFGNVNNLNNENAIIISESDIEGKQFFRELYKTLNINIFDYSFKKHDQTTAYSLTIPFASTLVFASCMENQDAPGTTFKKHLSIARGLLSEDFYLLSEILFNKYSVEQLENIEKSLHNLIHIVKNRDSESITKFLNSSKENIAKI